MLRRCALELSSSGGSAWKLRRPLSSKTHLIPRNAFSSASRPPQGSSAGPKPSRPPQGQPASTQKPEDSGSGSVLPKLLLGGIVVGAAVVAAREAGYIDIGRHPLEQIKHYPVRDLMVVESAEENVDHLDKEAIESSSVVDAVDDGKPSFGEDLVVSTEGASEEKSSQEESPGAREDELPSVLQGDVLQENGLVSDSEISSEDNVDLESSAERIISSSEQNDLEVQTNSEVEMGSYVQTPVTEETVKVEAASEHITPHEDMNGYKTETPESLATSYSLQEEESPEISSKEESSSASAPFSNEESPIVDAEVAKSRDEPADEKIVLDLIQAIHIAEKRQAESDFHIFEEEKRSIKEKYDKELRDARARELMYAEEAALLDKELNKEKAKAAATVKMLQEKAEQNLKSELQHKEEEAEMHLEKARDLAKAQLNAAVASEKSSQMEKIAEANLHINALCMAFYARSEEARQNHSVHKLALGALALEEALSKGLPIQGEIEALHVSLVDIRSDALLDLVLSSLPGETLIHGTDTKLRLNQKFDALKGTLRHFSLIPPGGGGILTHAIARLASFIKVKESNTSGDGIESVISRVEKLLAEEKLAEAADVLEQGVSGTEAEGAIRDWVRQTKNRAIVEQAVILIRSYTTSVSLT